MKSALTAPLTLIQNANVFAPEALGIKHLLIGGDRVLWIGDSQGVAPSGLPIEVIDLAGQSLLPGLVDGHVHVTGGGGEDGFASRVPALPLSRYTRGGVTTVIGLLGTDDLARSPRELVAHVHGLREEGLSAWGYCGGYHLPASTITGSVRGDIAFIECLIGVGELAISDHRSSQPTLNELLRVASEAHVAGLMSGKAGIVHLHLGDGARGLDLIRQALDTSELPPRVFNPTHVNRRRQLFEEALTLAKRGCYVDITAFPVDEDEDAWSAADALDRYLESGAPLDRVSVSSDAGGCLPCFDHNGHITHMDVGTPGALLDTMRDLLTRGRTLSEVLPAFTRNPADLLRLRTKGRIFQGGDADLLVLDDQHQLRHVMARGVWHVRDAQALRRGQFEQATHPHSHT